MLRPDRVCLGLESVVFVAVFGGVMVGCGGSSLATYAGLRRSVETEVGRPLRSRRKVL
jgi:hypothetical protein